jgi:hypothetical protein
MRASFPFHYATDKLGEFWCAFSSFLKASMWILLRLRAYVSQQFDPRRLGNSRFGTLSAQLLYSADKLDPGGLEFLLFILLDFACHLLFPIAFLD